MRKIAKHFHTTVQEIASVNPGLDVNNPDIGQTIRIPRKYTRTPVQSGVKCISKAELALNNDMRLIWEQHVYWTRMVIMGIAFGLPDTQFVVNRLLRNAKDLAAAFKPFYGEAIAAEIEQLFTGHLVIAAEIVQAAKAGDSAAAADAEKRWYANADQIAAFLASINPHWSEQEWQKMMYDHLAMTKAEAVDILTGKYEAGIIMFDDIERQALDMADMMTHGIVSQFPEKFR